ncbi:ribosomal protein S18-alanine N-acetyltransferase [Rhodoferax fermentans]|uniref:[Ribosomal protein bS18]-alanine N-acetyltransferase n=1 Tax=Rhodoferax fermentans TaxID=28066 RepID=A0A1T1ARW9_RHOFE|nr:ribosomal protein S18-alanine N-acetyltransferase [Rhodoferax fermentans]MBK1682167.1 ribosomal-protein-alanine N-acetyltransferase [Rhodoferax fermentans]OOV06807.1 ribosomal-protein-alanine N-acetyltransferase [Rhodoferax fermentans]
MNAQLQPVEVRFEPMREADLDAVLALEQQAYSHPWQRRHFADCLAGGYQAQMLLAGDTLLGYFVAMQGFEEVHLLNLAVAPGHQRQGWAKVMLDALVLWARGQGLQWVWLEARASNTRAVQVYKAHGFRYVGLRKQYYPAELGQREDALVMSLKLETTP